MANARIKVVIQYILMAGFTALLLWLSLKGLGENKGDQIWNIWAKSNKTYLALMAVVLIVSHIIRAERWKMLLAPTGNHIKLSSSFISLMIGYLVNLAIPRGGEVSRCYNLLKLEKTPVETSFGTVVTERLVDLLCLFVLICLCFVIEWTRLMDFINTLNFSNGSGGVKVSPVLVIAVIVGAGVVIALVVLRKNQKLRKILTGFKEGLLSVFRLKNKSLFIFYSIAIWFLYGLSSYCVLKAFPETEHLGISGVLTLFAIGSIAMAAPVPGGAGAYETLVPAGLLFLYAIPRPDGTAVTIIFHAWQTLIQIVGGVICLVVSYFIIRWREAKPK